MFTKRKLVDFGKFFVSDAIMLPENSSFTLGEMTFKEKENWNSRIRLFLDLRKDIENGKFNKS